MKKKILILNGSHSEISLINSAKRMGLKVITTGNEPRQIGHKFSDLYIRADFSKKNLILQIAKKNKIDFICPPAHDLGIVTASYVARKLNLPGYDSLKKTEIIHHKNKFKLFCKKHNIKTPKVFDENQSYHCIKKQFKVSKLIIKPTDMGGGKGISVVDDQTSYKEAILLAKKVSKSKQIVVEQYVEGQLHSLTSYLKNNKILFYHHDNELTFKNPYNVHSSFAPSTLKNERIKLIVKELELFAQKLKLTNGILHAQIISNKTDYFIIELTRRCSGDLYPLPVEFAANVPWSKIIVKSFMGKKISITRLKKTKKLCARHCLTANKNGFAKKIFIHNKIQENIIFKVTYLKKDQLIKDFQNEKYGVFVLKFLTLNEMRSKMSKINQLIFIET